MNRYSLIEKATEPEKMIAALAEAKKGKLESVLSIDESYEIERRITQSSLYYVHRKCGELVKVCSYAKAESDSEEFLFGLPKEIFSEAAAHGVFVRSSITGEIYSTGDERIWFGCRELYIPSYELYLKYEDYGKVWALTKEEL